MGTYTFNFYFDFIREVIRLFNTIGVREFLVCFKKLAEMRLVI